MRRFGDTRTARQRRYASVALEAHEHARLAAQARTEVERRHRQRAVGSILTDASARRRRAATRAVAARGGNIAPHSAGSHNRGWPCRERHTADMRCLDSAFRREVGMPRSRCRRLSDRAAVAALTTSTLP